MKAIRSMPEVDMGIRFLEKLSAKIKYTFAATFIIGFVAHGFGFANKISNHDDLYSIRAYGASIGHGRWFQSFLGPVVSKFDGNYTNPWVLGLVSLFLLAIAACFVVEALNIQNIYSSVLTGGIMVSFPAITGNFAFMFSAPYYSFAILLISVAAYLFAREKALWYSVVAIFCVACSMGIYQAYYPFLAGILLIVLIKKAFSTEDSVAVLCREAVRYLIDLAMSMAVYFVLLRLVLNLLHTSLGGHRGIDTMGSIRLSSIPGILVRIFYAL